MVTRSFSEIAEKASGRYVNVINGLRGGFAKIFNFSDPASPKAIKTFKAEAYAIAENYLSSEKDHIAYTTRKIALKAISDALESLSATTSAEDTMEAISKHLNASSDYIQNEIAIQLERDIASVGKKLRDVGLSAQLMVSSHGITKSAALTQIKLRDAGQFRFYFIDRNNRKWASEKYIRTIWREHVLDTYNEVFLYVLAQHGETEAMISHIDASSDNDGRVFAIDDYQEIKAEVFHPNSNAVVTRR